MRRSFVAIVSFAVLAPAAVPAQAGDVVKSKTKVVDTFDEEGDTVGIYDDLQVGDTVGVKTKTARTQVDGEQVTCKGSTSKPFEIENLKPGRVN